MADYQVSVRNNGGHYDFTYTVSVTESEANNTTNKSKVDIVFSIAGGVTSGNQYSGYNENWGILIDGTLVASGVNYSQILGNKYNPKVIGRYSGYVEHDTTGSKSIKISIYLWHGISGPNSNDYLPIQYSPTNTQNKTLYIATVKLTDINRGLVHVGSGSGVYNCQVYIGDGSNWHLLIPYVGNGGSDWCLCS